MTLAILTSQILDGEVRRRGTSISSADNPVLFWFEVAFLTLVSLLLIYGGLIGRGVGPNSDEDPPWG
jgi:hypothetical protein